MRWSRTMNLLVLSIATIVVGTAAFWSLDSHEARSGVRGGPPLTPAADPDALPAGCDLEGVQRGFEDFFRGVNTRDAPLVISRVATRRWQNGFGVALDRPPGGKAQYVVDSSRPRKIYQGFVGLRAKGWRFTFLGAKVQRFEETIPGRGTWSIPPGLDARERAVPFSLKIGMRRGQEPTRFRMLSGKGGMQCPQGRFFQWSSAIEVDWKPSGVCPGMPDVSPLRWRRPPVVCS